MERTNQNSQKLKQKVFFFFCKDMYLPINKLRIYKKKEKNIELLVCYNLCIIVVKSVSCVCKCVTGICDKSLVLFKKEKLESCFGCYI